MISAGYSTTAGHAAADRPAPESRSGDVATFVGQFARAAHRFGLPSHRLERALEMLASRLGARGQFFATPTAVFASLEEGGQERTVLLRTDPGEVHLEKLARLDALLRSLERRDLRVDEAGRELDAIVEAPSRYDTRSTTFGFALASASAAPFFGGGLREATVCAFVGLVTGLLAAAAARFPGRFRVFEPAAAFCAGFIATAAASLAPPVSVYVTTCAGLIVLIPGLSLTVAINELAVRHLVAGSVRMAGALLLFLQIGFGVAAGVGAGGVVFGGVPDVPVVGPATPWLMVSLALAAVSFTILFRAAPRDLPAIAAAGAIAFVGARVGSATAGMEMGAFTGALLVGLASNAYARVFDRPASVTLVPGLMLLVPGSVGFRGLSSLMANDVLSGIELAFRMGLTGVALVTGLLVAGSLLLPRRPL